MIHPLSRIRLISIVLISIFFVSGMTFAKVKWGKVTDEEWNMSAPADYPEANAVVIFDKGTLEITWGKKMFERHVRIKILNNAGIEEVGDIGIRIREDDKIRSIKAHTIGLDGKKYKVNKKEILEKTDGDFATKTIAFPNLEPGCIIEYRYSYSNEGSAYASPWFFQSRIYTLYSEFKLHLWPGWLFNVVTSNLTASEREPETTYQMDLNNPQGQKHQIDVWRVYNRPPIKNEPYMSFRENYLAAIRIQLDGIDTPNLKKSYSRDWSEIGERWQKWIDVDYVNKRGFVKTIAESLTTGIVDKTQKVKTLYNYVKDNYKTERYSGKYFGNDKLSQLIESKIGSSDEKNVFLTELINAVDIPVWNVLIGTRNKRTFDPNVIQDHQFNHIITLSEIDGQYIYSDTKSKYIEFGTLPVNSRSNGGLCIDGKDSYVAKILFENPDSYRRDITKLFINTDGSIICTTTVKCSGYQASYYGELYESETVETFVKDYFLDKLDVGYEYDTPVFNYDGSGLFTMQLSYVLNDYVREIENNCIVKPIQYQLRSNPFKNEKRFFPVDFSFPVSYYNTVEIKCADSIVSHTLPDNSHLEFPGSSFDKIYTVLGNKIVCESHYYRKVPIVLEKAYRDLRQFFIDIAETVDDEIVLTRVAE